jgi:hypothetical protein
LFYYNRIKSGEMEEMEREKAPPSWNAGVRDQFSPALFFLLK